MEQNLIDVRNFVNLNLQVLDFEDLFLFTLSFSLYINTNKSTFKKYLLKKVILKRGFLPETDTKPQ